MRHGRWWIALAALSLLLGACATLQGEVPTLDTIETACEEGCTLTPGYWKTHSDYGPAPYDDTWALLGEDTPFFASGQTYYEVLHTSPRGNGYYILAHAWIAARLNQLAGADTSAVATQLADAAAWFVGRDPASLTKADQAAPKALAKVLDDYNNGYIGPGHCPD